MADAPLVDIAFEGDVIEWRGPAPFHFVAIPAAHNGQIRYAARITSYGWGVVRVRAAIGAVDFETSLFPRDGAYLLPLKDAVRSAAGVVLGDRLAIRLRIYAAAAAAAMM